MKIAYVLHGRFPTEKAHGVQIAKLCEALGRAKHEVVLIAPQYSSIKQNAYDFYGVEHAFSVRYISMSGFARGTPPGFFFDKLLFLRRAAAILRELEPGLTITREPLLFMFAPAERVVLEMHYVPKHLSRYRKYLRRARIVVAKTNGMRDDLVAADVPSEHVFVLPNAIDPREYPQLSREDARRALNIESNRTVALYAGSLQVWKGVETLLRASTLAPEIAVVVVGGSPAEVVALDARYPSVRFAGAISHAKIPTWLAASDALVLPNERGTELSERYTSPLKLFEYRAAGKPVVASSLPSIREALPEDEGYFFEPGDAQGLADMLRKISANPDEAARRGALGRQRVFENTWDAYARRLLGALE